MERLEGNYRATSMHYTKAQREQKRRAKLFKPLNGYPEDAISTIRIDDYMMLPVLVMALARLHIDHFNAGKSPNDLWDGTDSQTRDVALLTHYFGITEYQEGTSNEYYNSYRQVVPTDDIKSYVKAGAWSAKDIVIALHILSRHCGFFGLSHQKHPFTPDITTPEISALLTTLIDTGYLRRIDNNVQWTPRFSPYL